MAKGIVETKYNNVLANTRMRLELSQQEMADLMGVPVRTYQDLEYEKNAIRQVHINALYFAELNHTGKLEIEHKTNREVFERTLNVKVA